uniref:Uncharacterized protein n=1 Tax=Panagrolaimus sp. PS1159 TaxID=55785 RepID=A0AC35F4V6_9BILA
MRKSYNNNNNRAPDFKIKNLEAYLNKANDIAELGAKAIESPYISILFDSQQNFAEILKGTPILTQIYKNIQGLVLYSKEKKEENLKLNDRIKELVEKAVDNDSDKNIIAKLCESISLLEKEKIQLNGKINELESSNKEQKQQISLLYSKLNDCVKELIEKDAESINDKNVISDLRGSMLSYEKEKNQLNKEIMNYQSKNEKQQKLMKTLYLKGEAAKSKIRGMKKLEEECKTMALTIKNFVTIKKYLEDTVFNVNKTTEEAYQDSEKLQQAVEDLSNDKAQLEEKCVNALFEVEERKKYETILESAFQAADEKIHNLSQSEKALKDQSEELRKRLHKSINDKKQSDEEKEQLCINENQLKKYNKEIEKNLKCQKDENAYLKNCLVKHV